MQLLPLLIGNEYCNFPNTKDFPISFRFPTDIGDFQNLLEVNDLLKDLKNLFRSRFSFARLIYLLSRKDCKVLNELEKTIIKTLSKEQIASFIRPASTDDKEITPLEERLPINEIKRLRDSIITVLTMDMQEAYTDIGLKNLNNILPYNNLYKVFSNYFKFYYSSKDIMQIMKREQAKYNIDYDFSEEEMIKAMLLFCLFRVNPENILEEIKTLKELDQIKIELAREDLDLKNESDAEIKKMFEDGSLSWYEGELLEKSKARILSQVKSFIGSQYRETTKEMIDRKDKITKVGILKSRWGDVHKTRFSETSFKTNTYNLIMNELLTPVVYIFDEVIYSICIGKYALDYYENNEDSLSLDQLIFSARKEFEELLIFKSYWTKPHDLKIKIFDKNGVVYQEFDSKEAFIESFKANNKSLETYYKRVKENNNLVNILFTGKQEYSSNEIKVFANFAKRLYKYLKNNGDKSRLLRFPDIDLRLNSSSIINLFETLIEREEELKEVFKEYYQLLLIFFNILIRNYIQGYRWFNLTGTGFKEESYIGKITKVLVNQFGLENVCKTIISIAKIRTRTIDKKTLKRAYLDKYNFIFNPLEISSEEILETLYNLFKELQK